MGLSSQIVLDQNFFVGQLFGAGGTPSAVLLDAEGAVASEAAAGAANVMALATKIAVRIGLPAAILNAEPKAAVAETVALFLLSH
jgi:hypothetical protein